MTKPQATMCVDALQRLAGAASSEQTRFYLNGVCVMKRRNTDGVLLCAMDGHMLALENDEHGTLHATDPLVSIIVHTDAIADIVRVAKARHKKDLEARTLRVGIDRDGFVLMANQDIRHSFTSPTVLIDGTFPDVERVIPRFDDDAESTLKQASFDAKRVLRLAATAKTTKNGSPLVFRMWQTDSASPAVMRVAGAPKWLGVLMPILFEPNDAAKESSNVGTPQWLR